MVKNIQTNTFLGSVFDEEYAGSHNFAQNLLHHRHFDAQKQIVLQLYYVVQRSTCGGAQILYYYGVYYNIITLCMLCHQCYFIELRYS